jgi:hypothetical protein
MFSPGQAERQEVHLDTYIVRIYRRDDSDPDMFAGIVEEPGIVEKRAFTNLDGLVTILGQRKERPSMPNPSRAATRPRDT